MPYLPMRMAPDGTGYVEPIPEPGPLPQPAYAPESSASYQYETTPAGPPPQPEYIPTDPGYQTIPPPPVPSTLYGGPDPNAPTYSSREITTLHPASGEPTESRLLVNMPAPRGDGDPPPRTPTRPIPDLDIPGALMGFGKFLANYLPGGRRSLAEDMTAPYLPYDQAQARYGENPGTALVDAQKALPEWLAYINSLYRGAWFDTYRMAGSTPDAKQVMDRTDAYMGINPDYLRLMSRLPEYMAPVRPLIARGAHLIAKAPGPSWSPPPMIPPAPVDELNPAGFPDAQQPWERFSLEPGRYYDDPYIPGPDHGRKRSA